MNKVKIVLKNHHTNDLLDYDIHLHDNALSDDWKIALSDLLRGGYILEKNYCFMGFPNSARNLTFLCDQLNESIAVVNSERTQTVWHDAGIGTYVIEDYFSPDAVRFPPFVGKPYLEKDAASGKPEDLFLACRLKHGVMNRLHNHFERLQGTVGNLSPHYRLADDGTKWAIRQLNLLCHEIESLCLSQRKNYYDAEWVRPSQITTWLSAPRVTLTDEHRKLFDVNQYDREFGGVYMHWAQIGKTLYEVWRDEHAPKIDKTTCEAITELEFFSGEFDVEWGKSVTRASSPWHMQEQTEFKQWLADNGYDPEDSAGLSLGYLPIGQIDYRSAFGTEDHASIIDQMGEYLDIYKIEVDGLSKTYDYHWADDDWKERQIEFLRPGYRYTSNV